MARGRDGCGVGRVIVFVGLCELELLGGGFKIFLEKTCGPGRVCGLFLGFKFVDYWFGQ